MTVALILLAYAVGLGTMGARMHAQTARLVGRPEPALGAVVVEHSRLAAYCVAGRQLAGVLVVGSRRELMVGTRDDVRADACGVLSPARLHQPDPAVLAPAGLAPPHPGTASHQVGPGDR